MAGYDFELSCNDAVVEVFPLQRGDKTLEETHYAALLAQVSLLFFIISNNSSKTMKDSTSVFESLKCCGVKGLRPNLGYYQSRVPLTGIGRISFQSSDESITNISSNWNHVSEPRIWKLNRGYCRNRSMYESTYKIDSDSPKESKPFIASTLVVRLFIKISDCRPKIKLYRK